MQPMTSNRNVSIRRKFVAIAEGELHLRAAGPESGTPLVMCHASPGSSKQLEPLIGLLSIHRPVLALDTLGNGDSSPPSVEQPEIPYFADAHRRALDALDVDRFDVYGTHTGANIAIELAIRHPTRVRRVILDGVSLYSDAERDDMLAHHAPPIVLDDHGAYLVRAWNFVRDAYLFWPWYKRGAAHRRALGVPPVEVLHDKVLEVLKAARTYHLSYNAAIRYPKPDRLPLVRAPTLVACASSDMLITYHDAVTRLMPAARSIVTAGIGSAEVLAETAATFTAFLDEADR